MNYLSDITVTCWAVFWIYWLIMAVSFRKKNSSWGNRFAPVRLVIFILAIVIIHISNKRAYDFKNLATINNQTLAIIGFIVFLAGLALAIWARVNLAKNWAMPMTLNQDPELVTSGPYHYIRHPVYSGILLATLGSVFSSSIYWLIILIAFGVYFISSAVVEEKILTKQFPKLYPAYKSETKMLIPFVF